MTLENSITLGAIPIFPNQLVTWLLPRCVRVNCTAAVAPHYVCDPRKNNNRLNKNNNNDFLFIRKIKYSFSQTKLTHTNVDIVPQHLTEVKYICICHGGRMWVFVTKSWFFFIFLLVLRLDIIILSVKSLVRYCRWLLRNFLGGSKPKSGVRLIICSFPNSFFPETFLRGDMK